jgi:hypothetical protein
LKICSSAKYVPVEGLGWQLSPSTAMSKEKFELEFGQPIDVVQRSTGQLTLAQGRMFGALYESILYGDRDSYLRHTNLNLSAQE